MSGAYLPPAKSDWATLIPHQGTMCLLDEVIPAR